MSSIATTAPVIPGRIWTTTGADSAGATIAVHQGQVVVLDHGMPAQAAAALLELLESHRARLTLARLVWTHWDNGLCERAPEHLPRTYPGALPTGTGQELEEIPGVRLHRVGRHQLLAHDRNHDLLIAGDLFAPSIPELSALTLGQAREALIWAGSLMPSIAVGTRGMVHTDRRRIRRMIATRLTYLDHLETVAREGVHAGLSASQIQRTRPWASWPGDQQRHVINTHAAVSHVTGAPMSQEQVRADMDEIEAEREVALAS